MGDRLATGQRRCWLDLTSHERLLSDSACLLWNHRQHSWPFLEVFSSSALHQAVTVKKKLSYKAKLAIYLSIYFLTRSNGHKIWNGNKSYSGYMRPKCASPVGQLGSVLEMGRGERTSRGSSEWRSCSSASKGVSWGGSDIWCLQGASL